MSASYTCFCAVSGIRIITMSASATASATVVTARPAARAFSTERDVAGKPTRTSTPDSCRLSAWAWPWLP